MRLELTKKADLAMRAMVRLAREQAPEPLGGERLAEAISTTVSFLPQVLRPMVGAGWIDSWPGPRGGYRITEVGRRVSVLALIEAVEGPVVDGRCVLRAAPCPRAEACALHDAWTRARGAMVTELGRISVIEQTDRHEGGNP